MLARETLGLILGDAGDYERALVELDLSLAQAQRMGSRMFVAVTTAEKVEVLLRAGRATEARAAATELTAGVRDRTWWFALPMVTPILAWLASTNEEMNSLLDEGAEGASVQNGAMMMLFHSRAADTCLIRANYARAARHAQALLDLKPDSKYLQRQARQVLALVAYASGSRDAALLQRISELRAEAELGGHGAAVATIDRVLNGTA